MRLVDNPMHLPGVCLACKGGTGRRCVDTLSKVGNWRVYVCEQCFGQMAELFGFVDPNRHQDARSIVVQMEQDIVALETRVQALSEQLREAEAKQVRVVSVDEVVPYVKKLPGRPRTDGSNPAQAKTIAPPETT